jgi:hypothetical protein
MDKFERYLAAYDGSTDWSTVEPLFDDAFDDDCVFVTAEGELSKDQWAEMAKGLLAQGTVASNFEILATEGDTVAYRVTVTPAGGDPMHLSAKGTLRDGRLIHVEPVDPEAYSDMVDRSAG